jgi:hypothetical protein
MLPRGRRSGCLPAAGAVQRTEQTSRSDRAPLPRAGCTATPTRARPPRARLRGERTAQTSTSSWPASRSHARDGRSTPAGRASASDANANRHDMWPSWCRAPPSRRRTGLDRSQLPGGIRATLLDRSVRGVEFDGAGAGRSPGRGVGPRRAPRAASRGRGRTERCGRAGALARAPDHLAPQPPEYVVPEGVCVARGALD